MFLYPVVDKKYTFWKNLAKKVKIVEIKIEDRD